MRVYRLRHKQYKGDVVFGMPPTYCKKIGDIQINNNYNGFYPLHPNRSVFKSLSHGYLTASTMVLAI